MTLCTGAIFGAENFDGEILPTCLEESVSFTADAKICFMR